MLKVSNSRISTYLSCPYKHYLSYVERLRTKAPSRPLTFGGDFHSLLQHRHDVGKLKELKGKFKETFDDAPSSVQSELGDDYVEELMLIFNDYRRVWKGEERPIEAEHEFLLPIGKLRGEQVMFHGFIDEIYEDDKIGEHKTFTNPPPLSTLAMNTQVCLYSKSREIETGTKAKTVMWDYIKSRPSKMPVWLDKSGRFSSAANSQITPYSWLRACDLKGISDREIRSKANDYRHNIGNFFFRAEIEILPEMVDQVWDNTRDIIKEIATKGSNNKIKNISRDCSWCNFRDICYAEFTGADVDYIKETNYMEREDTTNVKK